MANFKGDGKAILLGFVGAIATLVLIGTIATQINLETNTFRVENQTITLGAVNVSVELTGRSLVAGTQRVQNESAEAIIDYHENGVNVETITSATSGLRTVAITVNDTNASIASQVINVSYEYQPDGYIPTAAGRSITSLIILFAALAIVIFVIVMFIRDGSLGKLIGRR